MRLNKKALFLDRDGVVNFNYGHVHKINDFVFIPGIFEVCKYFMNKKYEIFIITNQAGIAKGYYTENDFNLITKWMLKEFNNNNIFITKVYFCPHKDEDMCSCRKPKPGMILNAQREFNINLSESILIGDSLSDITAGESAGVKLNFHFTNENHTKTINMINEKLVKFKNI